MRDLYPGQKPTLSKGALKQQTDKRVKEKAHVHVIQVYFLDIKTLKR